MSTIQAAGWPPSPGNRLPGPVRRRRLRQQR